MDFLKDSWGRFTRATAKDFLRTTGAPVHSSMDLMVRIFKDRHQIAKTQRVLDVGCGNASFYASLLAGGAECDYIGVDFSPALLRAARELHPGIGLYEMDVQSLAMKDRSVDYVVFSHVLEMLASPEKALRESKRVCRKKIFIRFCEPPVFKYDEIELRYMDDGGMGQVPYIRRKLSKDAYDMMLNNCGIGKVEIHKDTQSKDQIHVLSVD